LRGPTLISAATFQGDAGDAPSGGAMVRRRFLFNQIDDQMRVALRTSRFVVADLTRGNRGAYWEAGFAEGLGRPVIYTCRMNGLLV
jgi:nucleoside 2-deoxyribosyltransferase